MKKTNEDFNLFVNEWIPVLLTDGRTSLVSLEQLFRAPDQIREIFHQDPTVVAAIWSFILALMYRAYDGKIDSMKQWQGFVARNDFKDVLIYLKKIKSRLNLFGDEAFMQCTGLEAESKLVSELVQNHASGNNDVLFNHHNFLSGAKLTPAEAAQQLLANHSYSIKCNPNQKSAELYGSAKHAILVAGAFVLIRDKTLSNSLWLNFISPPFLSESLKTGSDTAAWERDSLRPRGRLDRPVQGIADLLSRQPRRIRLLLDDDGFIRNIYYEAGENVIGEIKHPYFAYRDLTKAKKNGEIKILETRAISLSVERSIWRDSTALFATSVNEDEYKVYQPPMAFQQFCTYQKQNPNQQITKKECSVLGVDNNKSKMRQWFHERMPLSVDLLNDKDQWKELHEMIVIAEKLGGALRYASLNYAKILRSQTDEEDPPAVVTSCVADYWFSMDLIFQSSFEMIGDGTLRLADWAERASNQCRRAFGSIAAQSNNRRSYEAYGIAKGELERGIYFVNKPFTEVEKAE